MKRKCLPKVYWTEEHHRHNHYHQHLYPMLREKRHHLIIWWLNLFKESEFKARQPIYTYVRQRCKGKRLTRVVYKGGERSGGGGLNSRLRGNYSGRDNDWLELFCFPLIYS